MRKVSKIGGNNIFWEIKKWTIFYSLVTYLLKNFSEGLSNVGNIIQK